MNEIKKEIKKGKKKVKRGKRQKTDRHKERKEK